MLHAIVLANEPRPRKRPAVGADPAQHHVAAVKLLTQGLEAGPGLSLLPRVVANLYAARTVPCRPIVPEHLWEMGDVQLPGRRQRASLWIARRLTDRAVWTSFAEAIRKRPAPGLRIVLSLTPTDRLEKDIHLGHSIVALRDVALATDPLVVDPAILAARISGSVTRDDQQISIAAEGAVVTVLGNKYRFTGVKQRAIIRHLHEAYTSGTPECITSQVLEAAECGASVNTLAKAFAGREDWRDFIAEEGGRCWMFC
ncbi:hypothetical protein [Neoroseomonas eburnea]|nr:hypothetical protein [Neoroseomonas eburnea]